LLTYVNVSQEIFTKELRNIGNMSRNLAKLFFYGV
jgi:hypothetical protein